MRATWCCLGAFVFLSSATVSSEVIAEAPILDSAPEILPAGANGADPSPVAGPSGAPASLDDILAGAGVTAPQTPLPEKFVCFGNEPFWSLSIEGGVAATFSTPDLKLPQSYTVIESRTALGRLDYPLALDLYAGLRSAIAVIEHEACSDGMSDTTHLWSAHIHMKDQAGASLLTGCCRIP